MGEQIDTINKAKAKCEKDKAAVERDRPPALHSHPAPRTARNGRRETGRRSRGKTAPAPGCSPESYNSNNILFLLF